MEVIPDIIAQISLNPGPIFIALVMLVAGVIIFRAELKRPRK